MRLFLRQCFVAWTSLEPLCGSVCFVLQPVLPQLLSAALQARACMLGYQLYFKLKIKFYLFYYLTSIYGIFSQKVLANDLKKHLQLSYRSLPPSGKQIVFIHVWNHPCVGEAFGVPVTSVGNVPDWFKGKSLLRFRGNSLTQSCVVENFHYLPRVLICNSLSVCRSSSCHCPSWVGPEMVSLCSSCLPGTCSVDWALKSWRSACLCLPGWD